MASKILLKKSTTASTVPTTLDLDVGEVAINTEDKRLFTKDSGGSIVEVSTTPSTLAVDGNTTVGGTLGVTGTTTAGTVNATNVTVSGTLTVPTPSADTDAASKGYVDTEITSAVATVIDSSPAALDTLNELAAALGDDPNFSTTITTTIGTKLPKDGSEAMTGNLNLGTNKVVNVVDPTSAQDAATKTYVDTADATKLNLSGGTMTGDITMGANSVTSTATPSTDDTLTRKGYVDSILGSATSAATSASEAAASASAAATSASNASTSESNAATSAASAAASYDDFDDRYLGPKATAPALDNDGDALVAGALYFDTTVGAMYVYDGSAWDQVAITVSNVLTVNNNLSDLQSAATALTNLGITATATELNYVDGVTSNIQTQIDAIDPDPTKGTLTKTFTSGEQASITLSSAVSTAPVVTVTKEVAQTGVSSKGAWDVNSTGSNYTLHDTAYATTLTPGTIGFDISSGSYDSVSFSVASQEATVNAVVFNSDGTKMYIVGQVSDTVHQYSLSTAYDLSTASYDSVSLSVSAQDAVATGIAFNNDGTKMYIAGNTNDNIFQYSLSTAFDLSTASYDSVSFSVSSEETALSGVVFNSDGTKMYIVGFNGDEVNQYSLSTAFDISTASFDSVTFSVASQDLTPENLVFNTDGTKMYIVGSTNDTIYEYVLSTAFDLSTASYNAVSFSVGTEDAGPTGIAFNSDGTKMYISGRNTDTIFQYSTSKDGLVLGSGSFASTDVGKRIVGNGGEVVLTAADGSYSVVTAFTDSSTIASGSWSMFALTFDGTDGVKIGGIVNGFDVVNASYDSKSFSVAFQDTAPTGLTFNNDGTKLYFVGDSTNSVTQCLLSTAYDVSTASYDSLFSVASQDTSPQGIAFNNDGTKMYIVGSTNDTVYQYTLSTAFDVSTASYASVSFSVASQDTFPSGLTFNNDGTKMYISGDSSNSVHQYTLSTAYDLSTASYDSVSFSVNSQEPNVNGLTFNNDGTKMYIVGSDFDTVHQYTFSTAFDLSTASYDSVSFSVASQDTQPSDVAFNNDGTKMYIVGATNDTVYQYSTGEAFVPTSQYSPAVTSAGGQIDSAFWTDINTMTVDETLNGGNAYYAVSTDDRTTWAVIDDTDGVRPIVRDNAGTWQYNDATTYSGTTWVNATTNDELYALSEALEDGVAPAPIGFQAMSTWSYDSKSFSVTSQETSPSGIAISTDGTKMFVIGPDTDSVYQYSLSTAYDISTASYDSVSFSVASEDTVPRDFAFNPDGTKMYVVGSGGGGDVFQYSLTTAFDLSTASYASKALDTSAQDSTISAIAFNSNGTKMFLLGQQNDRVYQYSLSTAYDVSTASYDSVLLNVTTQDSAPQGLAFNTDGTKMYYVGSTGDNVYQYTLSTGFDLSTASYDSLSFSTASQDVAPLGITFTSDGTKMYIVGGTNDAVFQYSTGTTGNYNRMDSTQLDAVTDPNHYTLGDTLDLAIVLYTASAGSIPTSDGVTINYDAQALNKGAILGTDYDFDFSDSTTVRITSNAEQNLKVRVV